MIEKLTQENYADVFELAKYAFHKEPTGGYIAFEYLLKHSTSYGYKTDGKVTSQVDVTPFEVNFWGARYKSTGIGYVASYPETRGNGAIHQIMARILTDEYHDGVVLSYLAPFSYGFYSKFGYAHIFNQLKLTWLSRDFPAGEKVGGTMERLAYEEALPMMRTVYANQPEMQRGALVRDSWWWNYWYNLKLSDCNFAVYFDDKHQPVGYVIYQFVGSNFVIKEWVINTLDARKATTRFIDSHAASFETFTYISPQSDYSKIKVASQMLEPLVKVEVIPDMQARIVNLEKFLARYPNANKNVEAITLKVTDEGAPWNAGVFKVTFGAATNGVEKLPDDTSGDVVADIHALTQWLFGYRTLAELLFTERIQVNADVAQLQSIAPNEKPILADYF
jgi:predicted acetyltransferase